MKISVYLKVKFRAFGITFSQFEKSWEHKIVLRDERGAIAVPTLGLPLKIVDFDQKGVRLLVTAS